jgi:hypothetical protein
MTKRSLTNLTLSIVFVTMTFASFRVTISAADVEPFFYYSTGDAIYYVGFAVALMVLWLQLAIGLIIGVVCRRVSAWWIAGTLWSVLGLFCVSTAVDTWTSDMATHVFQDKTMKPAVSEAK